MNQQYPFSYMSCKYQNTIPLPFHFRIFFSRQALVCSGQTPRDCQHLQRGQSVVTFDGANPYYSTPKAYRYRQRGKWVARV